MMFNLWLCRQQDDGLLHVPALPEGAVPQPEVPARRRRQVDDDGPVFFQILVWFEWVRSWVRTFCWICVSEGPTATKFALAESELYSPQIWRE